MDTKRRNQQREPLAYSLAELATAANVSRGTLYQEIESGRLESFKIGRRRLVRAEAARAWLDRLSPVA